MALCRHLQSAPLPRREPDPLHGERARTARKTSSFSPRILSVGCPAGVALSFELPYGFNAFPGYSRVFLTFASLYYMPLHPRTCSFLYTVSCLLDGLDGYAARYFNQSTTFGAVLDMVTDRCTTACLLVFLSSAWPRWAIIFQGLISLDMASHYMHMYATLSMGGSSQSHKKVDPSRSWIMYQYYTSKVRHPCSKLILRPPEAYPQYFIRSFCSFAALPTKPSSLACTSCLSPRRHCPLRSCSPSPIPSCPPLSLETPPTPNQPASSLVPGAPVHSRWRGRTSSRAPGHGSSPASRSPSWPSSSSSISSS